MRYRLDQGRGSWITGRCNAPLGGELGRRRHERRLLGAAQSGAGEGWRAEEELSLWWWYDEYEGASKALLHGRGKWIIRISMASGASQSATDRPREEQRWEDS